MRSIATFHARAHDTIRPFSSFDTPLRHFAGETAPRISIGTHFGMYVTR
jgi:hypothetical protein